MKKIVLLIGMVFFSLNIIAQKEGEKYLAPSISASFGRQYAHYTNYLEHYNASKPLDISVTPGFEFGYFSADNWRLAIAVGFPFYASPVREDDYGWDYDFAMEVTVNPSISYYVQLADRLFYTPEVGYRFGIAMESSTFDDIFSFSNSFSYFEHSFYANLLGLEYRVTEKFALGIGVGSIYYTRAKGVNQHYSYRMWQFTFNNSTVSALFYL